MDWFILIGLLVVLVCQLINLKYSYNINNALKDQEGRADKRPKEKTVNIRGGVGLL